jgi:hypothetical protein
MVYRLLFFDDFTNATVDVAVSPGAGTVQEPPGTSLLLSGSAGVDCDWTAPPISFSPVGYRDLASFVHVDRGLVFAEARLTSLFETSVNGATAGIVLWRDRLNFCKAGYTLDGQTGFLSEYAGGVPRLSSTGASMGDPGVVAHRFRLYWNPSPTTDSTDIDGMPLAPGRAAFYYSSDDGATWRSLDAGMPGFVPTLFGVVAGNHSDNQVGFTAAFDYMSLWQDDQSGTQVVQAGSVEDSGKAGKSQGDEASLLPGVAGSAEGTEDAGTVRLGLLTAYRPTTSDSEGHPFFIDALGTPRLRSSFVYDATGDPWSSPGSYQLDGYGRDGYFYIGGVKQAAVAPWALEPAGEDRSSRPDFPLRSLVVTSQSELSVFDLDSWPAALKLWMRFRLGNASNFYLLGRIADSLRTARMLNGVLMAGSVDNGTDKGGLFCIDFKRPDTSFAFLVRSDGWSDGKPGRNISNRNQTGNWDSRGTGFSLDSTYVHGIQAIADASDKERTWISAGSDNKIQLVETLANQPQFVHSPVGSLVGPRGDLVSGRKCAVFDTAGWLWIGWGPYVFRQVSDFRGGVLVMGDSPASPRERYPYAVLPHPAGNVVAKAMASVGDSLYVATNVGVYRVNRFTLDTYLCYTVPGGGGGGRFNHPPAGETLGGTSPAIDWIQAFGVDFGRNVGYLAVASSQATFPDGGPLHGGGAVTVVRVYDDAVVDRRSYTGDSSGLAEDGAWFLTMLGL